MAHQQTPDIVAEAAGRLYDKIAPQYRAKIQAGMERVTAADPEVATDPRCWVAAAMLRVIGQHLIQGYPLELPAEVIEVYLQQAPNIETPLFECEDCGYGVPRSFQSCPVCGGRTGLGAHSVKQVRRACFN